MFATSVVSGKQLLWDKGGGGGGGGHKPIFPIIHAIAMGNVPAAPVAQWTSALDF